MQDVAADEAPDCPSFARGGGRSVALIDWITERAGLSVALSYAARLESYCARLDLASERGTARDDIEPGLRIIGFERRATVAVLVESDEVVIMRLFYGGRDWEDEPI